MKTAAGHEEENLKLYVVHYNRGENIVEVEHRVGVDKKDILSQIEKYLEKNLF